MQPNLKRRCFVKLVVVVSFSTTGTACLEFYLLFSRDYGLATQLSANGQSFHRSIPKMLWISLIIKIFSSTWTSSLALSRDLLIALQCRHFVVEQQQSHGPHSRCDWPVAFYIGRFSAAKKYFYLAQYQRSSFTCRACSTLTYHKTDWPLLILLFDIPPSSSSQTGSIPTAMGSLTQRWKSNFRELICR